jgi:hypothetical protein
VLRRAWRVICPATHYDEMIALADVLDVTSGTLIVCSEQL